MAVAVSLGALALGSPSQAADTKVYRLQIQDDKFSKQISFTGQPESVFKIFGATRAWRLRSWVDKSTRVVTHQIYVEISYSGSWAFYQSAADENANDLPFSKIDQNIGSCRGFSGCDLTETVGVGVDDAMLRAKALTGFQVKLSAKSGDSLILDISPSQIQSELLTANPFLPPDRQWAAPASADGVPTIPQNEGSSLAPPLGAEPPHPWGAVAFGAPTTIKSALPRAQAMVALKAALESAGWTLASFDEASGRIVTGYRDTKLTTSQADCGKMIGIPYLMDGRAKTQTVLEFTVGDQLVIGQSGVRGYYKTGYGNPDQSLSCTPRTTLTAQPYKTALTAPATTAPVRNAAASAPSP